MKYSVFTIFIFLFLCSFKTLKSQNKTESPNIILIMCDDLGYGDTGFNGNEIIQTPNLDFLANAGVKLTNFHAGGPVCSPTRYTFLTGRHYARSTIIHANQGHLSRDEITIAEIAKAKGYSTGHFGKWHLGTLSKEFSAKGAKREPTKNFSPPWEHGYDETFVCESSNATWNPTQHARYKNNPYWENGKIATENLEGSTSKIIMDRVIPFIEKAVKEEKPFLSVIWFNAPHAPVLAGPEYRAMYSEYPESAQHYYGCVTAMDEQIGRLKNKLAGLDTLENTIVFFCSDNGPEGPKELTLENAINSTPSKIKNGTNFWGQTAGLRGRKRATFEGGIRVPAFVIWGDNFKNGTAIDTPLSTLDYLPTIANILEFNMPDNRPIDGQDIMPILTQATEKRSKPIPIWFKGVKFKSKSGNQSPVFGLIDSNNFKYQFNLDLPVSIVGKQSIEEAIYNLNTDQQETNNLAKKMPEELSKQKNYIIKWWNSAEKSKNGEDFK